MSRRSLFSSLFRQYHKELTRFISGKFGDGEAAQDIVQDAFHNLLKVEDITKIENPKAYLYRSARNLALNRLRHQGYQDDYLAHQQDLEIHTVSLDRQVSSQYDLQSVQKALNRLPSKYQKTFVLNRVEGKSYPQIALELGVSVSTVEKHIVKVLKFLREELPAGEEGL